jgi:hypothetical protein
MAGEDRENIGYVDQMTQITCTCGAVYHEKSQKLSMRDKDRADCDLCRETLNQWDEATMYSYTLVAGPSLAAEA